MSERLNTQRQPTRLHVRPNARYYVRGYNTNPHQAWGDSYDGGDSSSTVAATTAYAGIPGSFGPVGCAIPATQAAILSGGITAVPSTAWTTGQFVQSQVAGAAGRACWSGTGWVGGAAP
jgi:hypothetical protein